MKTKEKEVDIFGEKATMSQTIENIKLYKYLK